MARKNEAESNDSLVRIGSEIIPADIAGEMRTAYLDYAMSVITSRALPDARDGLKPVHRRILFAMDKLGLAPNAKFRKSAAVVGEVLGKYHPHGDQSVYDALTKLVQTFATRYPLIFGQGNFGSVDGDNPAAMRYTEAKLSKISTELLRDLDKETVDFRPNYDGSHKEPVVLPTAVPNLLLNGTLGIAVGMATNIPPHNLGEVVDATIHLLENDDATTEDLLQFVKGPDFPTGGIAFNQNDIAHAYATGRGGVVCRGEAEVIEQKGEQYQIIITSLPFRVVKSNLIENIANLVRDKKLEGIRAIRDESTNDIRIVVELKNGSNPQSVLNYIYRHTELETSFHYNTVALVDGIPQTLSLRSFLSEFTKHRKEVVRRRTEYDLRKAEEREHILLGLKKALDHIDEIIKLIKASKDTPTAHKNLMDKFKFSAIQATAILEMKLQRLASLERKKIEDELAEVQALITELKSILSNVKKMVKIIIDELSAIKEKYGDARRTKIVKGAVANLSQEDFISDDEFVLVYTSGGYVKRTDPAEFRMQNRGGVGVVDLDAKEEDFITHIITASAHSDLLFFTDRGKAYQLKMYDIPEGKRATRGKSIMNFLQIQGDEKVTSILVMPKSAKQKSLALMMVTKNGTAKKSSADSFRDVRRSGIIAIRLDPGDELLSALFVEKGDEVILATSDGQSIRFKESDIREMGRAAGGVRGMAIDKGDYLVNADVIRKDMKNPEFLVMTATGNGKKTPLDEYKTQKRGGSGIKTVNVTAKTGRLVIGRVITDDHTELIAISKRSQVIKVDTKSIPSLGRSTQGVKIMKPREGDSIASLTLL
ncbi:MAG: DNA gyrase subunit A [Minisyncoccia bacterium]